MSNPIPSTLINAKLYNEGREMLGAGTVELSDLEFMTESVAGLGMAGEMEVPVLGHTKSITMTVTWNTLCATAAELSAPKTHKIAIYASIQDWDTGSGTFKARPVRVMVQGTPKKSGAGKFEPGKKMESTSEFEVTYLKISIDGEEIVEIDKLNFVCRIRGEDYLSDVRGHLGM